jgi:hypothetical protein
VPIRTSIHKSFQNIVILTFIGTKAIINLVPNAPRSEPEFEASMEKTFTDCYFAPGFTGGAWAYASNSNDSSGESNTSSETTMNLLGEKERRLAYYCLGWESLQVSCKTLSRKLKLLMLTGDIGASYVCEDRSI